VWQYKGDDDVDAEVWSGPPAKITDEPGAPVYIALTEYYLASGVKHLGYTSPADWSGLDYVQPVIIVGREHVRLWDDTQGVIADAWRHLGPEKPDVFPITWRCVVPVDGDTAQGIIA
jgi:hypothetical protein